MASPSKTDDSVDPVGDTIVWSHSVEVMLAEWCDQAKCFEWMHTQAYSYFYNRARIMVVASNVLTAISGLSNVIAGGATVNGFQLAYLFGSLSIVISITNMLQEKLAYATLAADFLQYSNSWGSIRRKIEEQLALPPGVRQNCHTFLKYVRSDINLVSINGNNKIPDFIRDMCYQKFSKINEFDLPDIVGEMEHTRIYVASSDMPNMTESTIALIPK
jgi:hypothetical protein